MRMNDINKDYTNKVAEYLAKGYIINTNSMSGSQGEVAKIDLVKDNELIRIYLMYKFDWREPKIELVVGRWQRPAEDSQKYSVWYSELDAIEVTAYYEVSKHNDWYTKDYEEYNTVREKRMNRYQSRIDNINDILVDVTSEKVRDIVIPYIKRKLDLKRLNRDLVYVRKTNGSYQITYRQNTLVLKSL